MIIPVTLFYISCVDRIILLACFSLIYVNLPIINWTSEWLAHMMGSTPANKSIPFLYTSRLTTTMVTAKAGETFLNYSTIRYMYLVFQTNFLIHFTGLKNQNPTDSVKICVGNSLFPGIFFETSGVNTLASTALGITETMQGFIEARSTVFSLLTMQKTDNFLNASNQHSQSYSYKHCYAY